MPKTASIRGVLEAVAAGLIIGVSMAAAKAWADIENLKTANDATAKAMSEVVAFINEEREMRGRVSATLEAVNRRLDKLEE